MMQHTYGYLKTVKSYPSIKKKILSDYREKSKKKPEQSELQPCNLMTVSLRNIKIILLLKIRFKNFLKIVKILNLEPKLDTVIRIKK